MFTVEFDDDVSAAKPSVSCRTVVSGEIGHQCALSPVESYGLSDGRRNWLQADAEITASDLAVFDQLRIDFRRQIRRNRKAYPGACSRLLENQRVDAYHFTLHIDERATRVAGV